MKNLKTLLLLFLAIPLFICCEKDEPQNGEGGDSEQETEIVKKCVEQDGLLFDGILYYEIINQIEATVYCVEEDLCVGDIEIPHKIKLGEDVFTVTHIGEFAFDGCEEIRNIKIPNTITYIGEEAFECCEKLIEIIIPNSVTYIGEEAFAGCVALHSLTIGSSVKKIESLAFDGCDNISVINCKSKTPPATNEEIFSDYSATLNVPIGLANTYREAKEWNKFFDIKEINF